MKSHSHCKGSSFSPNDSREKRPVDGPGSNSNQPPRFTPAQGQAGSLGLPSEASMAAASGLQLMAESFS
eukprot:CAMPEP_0180686844 /NCGR_PEP_ID=MMETSP1037_2-20121125/73136_1 /TAXON_ID=632150 /ORGANISM="Azadinium spinosum, Strain 3D9" /LENGTH=68 /DNA_ID=CAMNT_0022717589 /DNA_START=147 /DNA_END=350 /DNA_ORIENTATION=-